jgi:xanthine/uracil permease
LKAEAPAASFIWVHTFPLKVYGPLVLPFLAVYIVLAMEAIGDITATCDVSRLEVSGLTFDSRIQGEYLFANGSEMTYLTTLQVACLLMVSMVYLLDVCFYQ